MAGVTTSNKAKGTATVDVILTGTAGKTLTVTADTSLDEAVAMSSKSPKTDTIKGDGTAGRVIRAIRLRLQPGATPGTNINVASAGSTTVGFNVPSINSATDLAASGTSGSFSLSADGKTLTTDLTESVVGIIGCSIIYHDLNSSSLTDVYFVGVVIVSGNLGITFSLIGSSAAVDLRTILDAGDTCDIIIGFITAS